ncbi:MAG: GGDEF domain-containing protein [Acidobacteriota bacterium]
MNIVSPPDVVLLARWSIGVQLGVVCLLAAFFGALARTMRLAEVRLWAIAWAADALALAAVFGTAFLSPPMAVARIGLTIYAGAKTAYVLLLVAGARHHLQPGAELRLRPRLVLPLIAAWSLAVGVFAPRIAHAQIAQAMMVAGMLLFGAVWVLRHPRTPRSRWLGWGLLAEGLLFLHYIPLLAPVLWNAPPMGAYLRYTSFFDAGAELFVGLAILVALEGSTTEHLRHLNRELEESQERLRLLVDLDPLTKLVNRRGLRTELQRVKPTGAAMIFIDLDGFKAINDRYGHLVGDACLQKVASVLQHNFRAEDTIFRWGGDEFLVIAPGLDFEGAWRRVSDCRQDLARAGVQGLPCSVSVGIAMLAPNGEPEVALKQADEQMYGDKNRFRSRAVSLDTWY